MKEPYSHCTVTQQKGCGKEQLQKISEISKNLPMILHHQTLQKEETTNLRNACTVSSISVFKVTKHSIKTS